MGSMKSGVKPIIIELVAARGAAYAANQTVTMNAIDAGGIGKEIGTLELSDSEAGLRVTPHLAGLIAQACLYAPSGAVFRAHPVSALPSPASYCTADRPRLGSRNQT
jgi:hypothetical protein